MEHNFRCNICDKLYKSYQSLWNHNRKFHNNNNNHNVIIQSSKSNPSVIQKSSKSNPKVIQHSSQNNSNIFCCSFCSKTFKYKQGKWKHEQKCSIENNKDKIINDLKQTIIDLQTNQKQEFDKLKKQLLDMMNKKCKMHPKTLH